MPGPVSTTADQAPDLASAGNDGDAPVDRDDPSELGVPIAVGDSDVRDGEVREVDGVVTPAEGGATVDAAIADPLSVDPHPALGMPSTMVGMTIATNRLTLTSTVMRRTVGQTRPAPTGLSTLVQRRPGLSTRDPDFLAATLPQPCWNGSTRNVPSGR